MKVKVVCRSSNPEDAGSIPSRIRPWSCIFRNWSGLGLIMYILTTLEFPKHNHDFHLERVHCILVCTLSYVNLTYVLQYRYPSECNVSEFPHRSAM